MEKKSIRTHRDLDVYQMGFEAEAAETQVWLEFAFQCGYLKEETFRELSIALDNILGKIVRLINNPQQWLLPGAKRR